MGVEGFILFTAVFVAAGFVMWIFQLYNEARKYRELRPELDTVRNRTAELDQKTITLEKDRDEFKKNVDAHWQGMEAIAAEKTIGFPWLAGAYADYFELLDRKEARYLEQKKHPAKKAAEHVREAAARRRKAEHRAKTNEYIVSYYESLFPWLSEFREEESDELIESNVSSDAGADDAARQFLTASEYEKLSNTEKYQLALDRYSSRRKSKWAIGRDYERYVGYLYESRGYDVEYKGILDSFEDMGRDIVARRSDDTLIVQCKCWSRSKIIHEKHIFQLFGTTIEFCHDHQLPSDLPQQPNLLDWRSAWNNVRPIFITTTELSDKARRIAQTLNVEVIENEPFEEWPMIKCNLSSTGERIYHLPFDQQYDRVMIEALKQEFFAWTIAEAEAAGYRRAFRWRDKT